MSYSPPSRTTAVALGPSLADVLDALSKDETLHHRRRQDMASAVRTLARLLNARPCDIDARAGALGRRMADLPYASHGLTRGRWNNIRSLVRTALSLVAPVLPGREQTEMLPSWRQLWEQLPKRADRALLSRLLRYLSRYEFGPNAVTADQLETFATSLRNDSLLKDPEATWRATARSWNAAIRIVPGWPDIPIPLPSRKNVYTLPWAAFPASLKVDVDRYLARLAGSDPLEEIPFKPVCASTVETRERQLRTFASALVLKGYPRQSLGKLADFVDLKAYKDGLSFFIERRGGQSSTAIFDIASLLKAIARHWVEADPGTLERMTAILGRLGGGRKKGLTEKNRSRLRPLNDPETTLTLLNLPIRLKKEVDAGRLRPRRAAVLAQTAVAIEILIAAPIRIGNLVKLEFDRHLIRIGRGNDMHLVIEGNEVKNRENLEFPLPSETVSLIEWYVSKHRPQLVVGNSRALFPGRFGGHKVKVAIGGQISKTIHKYTGLLMHPHLFRHAAALLYLNQRPGDYETVKRVLGHRSMETTTAFYAGLESAAAAKHFDNVVLGLRRKATAKP